MIEIPLDPHEAIAVLSSLSRFGTLPETRAMREWMRAELARLDRANRRDADPVSIYQRQGACQALEAIERLIETADEKVEKIKSNRRRE